MAEVVADSSEDVIRLFDQGNRILKLTSANSNDSPRFKNLSICFSWFDTIFLDSVCSQL